MGAVPPQESRHQSRMPIIRKSLGLAVFLLACFGAYRLGLVSQAGDEPAPLDAKALDFGETWESDRFPWDIEIENTTSQDIVIQSFETSCSCTHLEPKELLLRARQTAAVHLALDLTHSRTEESGIAVRDFSVQVLPRIKGMKTSPPVWTVHGKVKTSFMLSPQTLTFWEGLIPGRSFPTRSVLVRPYFPLASVRTNYDPNFLTVKVKRLHDSSAAYQLDVTPRSSLPAGKFSTEILVETTGQDGSIQPPKRVKVEGLLQGAVQAFPEYVSFGARHVGDKAEETVVLRAMTGDAFQLQKIDAAPEDAAVALLPTTDSSEQPLRITQIISKAGSHSRPITFSVRSGKGMIETAQLNISYHGIQP